MLETAKRQWLRREEKASKVAAATAEIEKLKAEVEDLQATLRLQEEVPIRTSMI